MNTVGQSSAIVGNFFFRDVELICAVGDVLHSTLDAICVSCDSNYSLNAGVGQLVQRAGGRAFSQNMNSTTRNGGVVAVPSTGCGRLRSSFVVLVPLRRAHRFRLDLVYAQIFQCARSNGIQSIAVPALGTGLFGVSALEAANSMKTALLDTHSFDPIQRIHFIDLNLTSLASFQDAISNLIDMTSPVRHANGTLAAAAVDDDQMDQDEQADPSAPSTSAAALAPVRAPGTPLTSRPAGAKMAAGASDAVAGPSNAVAGSSAEPTQLPPAQLQHATPTPPPAAQLQPATPPPPQTLAAGLCALMSDGPSTTTFSQVVSFCANLSTNGMPTSSANLPAVSQPSGTASPTASVPIDEDEEDVPSTPKKRRGVNAPMNRWTSTPPYRHCTPPPPAGQAGQTLLAQFMNNQQRIYNNNAWNRRTSYNYYNGGRFQPNHGGGRCWTHGGAAYNRRTNDARFLSRSPSPGPSSRPQRNLPPSSSRCRSTNRNSRPSSRTSARTATAVARRSSPVARPKYSLRLNSCRRRHLYRNSRRIELPPPVSSSSSSSSSSVERSAPTNRKAKKHDESESEEDRLSVASTGRSSSSSDAEASIATPYSYSDSSMSSFIDDDEGGEHSDATYNPSQSQRTQHDDDDEEEEYDASNRNSDDEEDEEFDGGTGADGGGGSGANGDDDAMDDDDGEGNRGNPIDDEDRSNGDRGANDDDESDDFDGDNHDSGSDDDQDDEDDGNDDVDVNVGVIVYRNEGITDMIEMTMNGHADAFMEDDDTDYALAATFHQHNWLSPALPGWVGGESPLHGEEHDFDDEEDEDDVLISVQVNLTSGQQLSNVGQLVNVDDDDGISDSELAAAVAAASASTAQQPPGNNSPLVLMADSAVGGSIYNNGAWTSVSAIELRTIRAAYLADEQRKAKAAAFVDTQEETAMPCAICLNELLEANVETPARPHRRPAPDVEEVANQNSGGVVRLNVCKHMFHEKCIKEAFKVKRRCPLCMCWCAPAEGNQPLGARMQSRIVRGDVPGYDDADGYHEIRYTIPSGIQTAQHVRPGLPFFGTTRIAYLPNNAEGTVTLRLLELAFKRRLTFSVGDSVTTGRQNVVIWNDIHHKTSKHGGVENYGYPDPNYLTRVQGELANLGIRKELLDNNNR